MSQQEKNKINVFPLIADFSMGTIYIGLSIWILVTRHFGNFELTGPLAYALIGLLVVYGAFRLYRGFDGYRKRHDNS